MDYSPIFTYNFANLALAQWTLVSSLIWIAIAFVITFLLYIASLVVWNTLKSIQNSKSKKKKSKILQDLVLMKDIQNEIEKEIEQARLKAAFQD